MIVLLDRARFRHLKDVVRVIALFCVLLVSVTQAASRFSMRVWKKGGGIPGNDIIALCQDREGYLWLSTSQALVRFDGSSSVQYELNDDDSQAQIGFTAIEAQSDGSLLLASAVGGLYRFESGRFLRHPLPGKFARSVVTGLLRAADGALWVGFKGGIALRQCEGREQIFTFEHGSDIGAIVQIVRDGAGRVWLSNGSVLMRYEGGKLANVSVRNEAEHLFIAAARENGPWVFSDERLFKIVDDEPIEISKINGYTTAKNLQSVVEDDNGDLWLGTRFRGVRRLILSEGVAGFRQQNIFEQPGDIAAVTQDSTGNIWAGSKGGGLVRATPAVGRIYNRSLRLVETQSLAVCQDNSGAMWFANRDGGVFYLQEPGRLFKLDRPPKTDLFSVVSVTPRAKGGIWLSSTYGLFSADCSEAPPKLVTTPFSRDDLVRVMFTARDDSLWLATAPGKLAQLKDDQWKQFDMRDDVEASAINCMAEDAKGVLWFGSSSGGVFRYDHARFERVPMVFAKPPGAIQALHIDTQGDCWMGTARTGLVHFKEKARVITKGGGLPSNNIISVISDDHGRIWFESAESIFFVRRSELIDYIDGKIARLHPVILGVDDGVGDVSCRAMSQPSNWKSADGALWFSTREGVVSINPSLINVKHPAPKIKINLVRFDGSPEVFTGDVRVGTMVREVAFKYSALCLSVPSRVVTSYKLDGYDDDWTYGTGAETAKYTRLPPGRYVLRIRAQIAGEAENSVTESVCIEVLASWWQTIWFKISVVVACICLVIAGVRIWSHKRLRRHLAQLEYEAGLQQERARIARNIHDDLGAGLTRISLLTQTPSNGGTDVQMDKIYNTVSELTRSMDEIVWAVNPKNDDLENLAGYLSEFAQSFLTDAGLRCRVLLPAQLPDCIVPAQHRHHLFLSCKETLNNIIKHARATEVSIQIAMVEDWLHVVIIDDGVGLPAEVGTCSGNGIKNIKSRMAAIDGVCEITSNPGTGTAVRLRVQLPENSKSCH